MLYPGIGFVVHSRRGQRPWFGWWAKGYTYHSANRKYGAAGDIGGGYRDFGTGTADFGCARHRGAAPRCNTHSPTHGYAAATQPNPAALADPYADINPDDYAVAIHQRDPHPQQHAHIAADAHQYTSSADQYAGADPHRNAYRGGQRHASPIIQALILSCNLRTSCLKSSLRFAWASNSSAAARFSSGVPCLSVT